MRVLRVALVGLVAVLAVPGAASACVYENEVVRIAAEVKHQGKGLALALKTADGRSDAQLRREFRGRAQLLRRSETQLGSLEPPKALKARHLLWRLTMATVVRDLFAIARAAKQHDPAFAKYATINLLQHSAAMKLGRLAVLSAARKRLASQSCAAV
jgi:hypothetical protein